MSTLHFLNVKQGDCSIIQHSSGRVSVIDVCNARLDTSAHHTAWAEKNLASLFRRKVNQKDYPVNPIAYLHAHGVSDIHRFIATHADMDHLDGIRDLFEAFPVFNLWDTANRCRKEAWGIFSNGFREEDWRFYERLRNTNPSYDPRRLVLYDGARGDLYNDGPMNDGLYILAPTPALIQKAILADDYNDGGYVILQFTPAGRILYAGDSHDATWEHILRHYSNAVADVEVLIAPHHGRHSNRSFEFLDTVRPKVTLFGNAPSEHLAYSSWRNRNLFYITNNQADCVVVDANGSRMEVYVTNEMYAREHVAEPVYSQRHQAYGIGHIPSAIAARAA